MLMFILSPFNLFPDTTPTLPINDTAYIQTEYSPFNQLNIETISNACPEVCVPGEPRSCQADNHSHPSCWFMFMNMYEYVHAVMAAIIVQYKSRRYSRILQVWIFTINLLLNSLKDGPSKGFVLVLVRMS